MTAAVHTMGNPIMTQLCVEIKTHVGYEEGSYLLELTGGHGLLLCVRWGGVNGIKCSPANTSLLGCGPTWLLQLSGERERVFSPREKKMSLFSKNCSYWIMRTNAHGVMLTIHPACWRKHWLAPHGEGAFYLAFLLN